jgi:hypothetical protein
MSDWVSVKQNISTKINDLSIFWPSNTQTNNINYNNIYIDDNKIKVLKSSIYNEIVDYDNFNNSLLNINNLYSGGNVKLITNMSGVSITGNLTATGTVETTSDIRLKDVIESIEKPIEKIEKLSAFMYTPNELALSSNYIANKAYIGISAQDVQEVFPELVSLAGFDTSNLANGNVISKSGNNYLGVHYERMIPVLIECVKELKNEINTLKR